MQSVIGTPSTSVKSRSVRTFFAFWHDAAYLHFISLLGFVSTIPPYHNRRSTIKTCTCPVRLMEIVGVCVSYCLATEGDFHEDWMANADVSAGSNRNSLSIRSLRALLETVVPAVGHKPMLEELRSNRCGLITGSGFPRWQICTPADRHASKSERPACLSMANTLGGATRRMQS